MVTFARTPSILILTSPTATSTNTSPPPLQVEIVGCDTSLEFRHQMGEVTNAFALIRNFSNLDLTGICATLFAIDEDREHPDKTACGVIKPTHNQKRYGALYLLQAGKSANS